MRVRFLPDNPNSASLQQSQNQMSKQSSLLLIAQDVINVSAYNAKIQRTYQLNGQLPDNPSCKDASSRQPASFCLRGGWGEIYI